MTKFQFICFYALTKVPHYVRVAKQEQKGSNPHMVYLLNIEETTFKYLHKALDISENVLKYKNAIMQHDWVLFSSINCFCDSHKMDQDLDSPKQVIKILNGKNEWFLMWKMLSKCEWIWIIVKCDWIRT